MTDTLFDILVRHTLLSGPQPKDTPPLTVETLRAHYVRDVGYLLDALQRARANSCVG